MYVQSMIKKFEYINIILTIILIFKIYIFNKYIKNIKNVLNCVTLYYITLKVNNSTIT